VRLVHHCIVKRRRKIHLRAIGGYLMVGRIHAHLRLDGDGPHLIPPRDVEALHLDVAQNFQKVAAIHAKQSGVDPAALVAQLPFQQVVGNDEVIARGSLGAFDALLDELAALLAWNEEKRVVLHLTRQAHIDVLDVEMRVAGQLTVRRDAIRKADRPLHQFLGREDPVDLVQ